MVCHIDCAQVEHDVSLPMGDLSGPLRVEGSVAGGPPPSPMPPSLPSQLKKKKVKIITPISHTWELAAEPRQQQAAMLLGSGATGIRSSASCGQLSLDAMAHQAHAFPTASRYGQLPPQPQQQQHIGMSGFLGNPAHAPPCGSTSGMDLRVAAGGIPAAVFAAALQQGVHTTSPTCGPPGFSLPLQPLLLPLPPPTMFPSQPVMDGPLLHGLMAKEAGAGRGQAHHAGALASPPPFQLPPATSVAAEQAKAKEAAAAAASLAAAAANNPLTSLLPRQMSGAASAAYLHPRTSPASVRPSPLLPLQPVAVGSGAGGEAANSVWGMTNHMGPPAAAATANLVQGMLEAADEADGARLAQVQGQLAMMHNWYFSNKNVYLEQVGGWVAGGG